MSLTLPTVLTQALKYVWAEKFAIFFITAIPAFILLAVSYGGLYTLELSTNKNWFLENVTIPSNYFLIFLYGYIFAISLLNIYRYCLYGKQKSYFTLKRLCPQSAREWFFFSLVIIWFFYFLVIDLFLLPIVYIPIFWIVYLPFVARPFTLSQLMSQKKHEFSYVKKFESQYRFRIIGIFIVVSLLDYFVTQAAYMIYKTIGEIEFYQQQVSSFSHFILYVYLSTFFIKSICIYFEDALQNNEAKSS